MGKIEYGEAHEKIDLLGKERGYKMSDATWDKAYNEIYAEKDRRRQELRKKILLMPLDKQVEFLIDEYTKRA